MVEDSLAPPPWMGPINAAAQAQAPEEKDPVISKLQEDYGKLVEAPKFPDVVLVVEGERFPAHRAVLAARSVCRAIRHVTIR